MFFGALAQTHPDLNPHDGDGFVIITAASDQGMMDIHDRKPLVLTPEHDLTSARAEEIAKECCQPVEDFELMSSALTPLTKRIGDSEVPGIASCWPDLRAFVRFDESLSLGNSSLVFLTRRRQSLTKIRHYRARWLS